jgi:hypothetical protein
MAVAHRPPAWTGRCRDPRLNVVTAVARSCRFAGTLMPLTGRCSADERLSVQLGTAALRNNQTDAHESLDSVGSRRDETPPRLDRRDRLLAVSSSSLSSSSSASSRRMRGSFRHGHACVVPLRVHAHAAGSAR